MCRIIGFVDQRGVNVYDFSGVVGKMRDTMEYGGPDDAGIFIDQKNGVALGHRRLSILDLSSAGHQPMSSDDGLIWITYNGEIYNFESIKDELQSKGYRFKSHTDTEVLIKAYQEWGIDCVQKFRGMWAFGLYDLKKNCIILCRDRVGVKPLYWYYHDGLFMFASEVKAFLQHPKYRKEINRDAVSLFFQYSYIPAPYSIFCNTYKLEPGHVLIFSCATGNIVKRCYWKHEDYIFKSNADVALIKTEDEYADELRKFLIDSFKLRLVSDVPVGVFLSGGIDSSLIAAILQSEQSSQVKTLSIGFEQSEYNEAPFAKNIASYLHTDHHELYCTQKDFLDIIPKLPKIYDEPFGDSSAIPTFLLSKFSRSDVKVVLSGDGGDELFCGYMRYWIMEQHKLILQIIRRVNKPWTKSTVKQLFYFVCGNVLKFSNVDQKYSKFLRLIESADFSDHYDHMIRYFTNELIEQVGLIPQKSFLNSVLGLTKGESMDRMMRFDFRYYLPDDILVKTDRATMAVGLECREPLLDHTLIEYAAGMPLGIKYRNKTSKYVLKEILSKYIPPRLFNRPKRGFGIPLTDWLIGLKNHELFSVLSKSEIEKYGILNYQGVDSLIKGKGGSSDIWLLLMFQLWCKEYL